MRSNSSAVRRGSKSSRGEFFKIFTKARDFSVAHSQRRSSIHSVPSRVRTVPSLMKILKNSRWFRRRRAVGFDRAGGAIESNCPSTSKSSRIFQNFHEHSDGTVYTLDGTQYRCFKWINLSCFRADSRSASPRWSNCTAAASAIFVGRRWANGSFRRPPVCRGGRKRPANWSARIRQSTVRVLFWTFVPV